MEILAAQQTPAGSHWYQGTADAVRQNLRYFLERPFAYYIILSGDQLYRMVQHSLEIGADAVIGMRYDATEFGQGGTTEVLAYGTAVKLR